MRWKWVPVAVAIAVAVAASAAATTGFDLSGPDGTGGQPEAAGLVVGVASGGGGKPTVALPATRFFGLVKLVNAWEPSSGALTRLRPDRTSGCSAFGAVPGARVAADSGGGESRWVLEAVSTPSSEGFVRLRSACTVRSGDGFVYLGRSGGPPRGEGPPVKTTWTGALDSSGFAQQWSLSIGPNANCMVLTNRWEAKSGVLTRDVRPDGRGGSTNTPAASVSLQRRNVDWASQCWTVTRA